MLFQLLIFFSVPILSFIFLKELELDLPDYLYIIGISILGSSIFSVEKMNELKKQYTFTSLLYISSVIFVVWGLFKFDWYLILIPMWIGSYYLYFIRRIIWVRLSLNGSTGLENINWDNFHIPMGFIITIWGLLAK
jgi:hypothetical protein